METFHKILQTKTILIAEDDPSTLKWLSRVLKIYFKEVYCASDAMEALEVFKEFNTDIIISDIQMPHVDGLSFLQKISSISPKTIKIVITAFNNEIYLNRAVATGVDLYFKKPLDIDELLISLALNLAKKKVESITELGEGFIYKSDLKSLQKDNKDIKLTKKETLLLELLIKNRYGVVSLEHIEQNIWNEPASTDAIRMVVVGLRKKLYPNLIKNIKGFGYKINI